MNKGINPEAKAMRFRKIFIASFVGLFFISACERGKETEMKVAEKARGAAEEGPSNLVTLKPEALEKAGIKVEPVSIRGMRMEFTFPGKVSVNETRLAHVASRIPGRAVEVFANLGDHVKKGQPLAVIDSPEIGEAQNHYLKAKTNLEVAEKAYARAKIILEGKVISTGEFQRREGEYLSAKADLKASEDTLHLLGMTDREISEIGRKHTINSRVSIYAPLSGTVIEKDLTLGELAEPVKPLFTIADLKNIWVIADITERDIPKIKKGAAVAVTVAPYPEETFRGKINYISETVNPETRSVKVRAEIENSKGILKPEMFASIKITSPEIKNVLAVPESAVQREGDKTIVFVEIPPSPPFDKGGTGGIFEKRVVEIGPELDGFHQVVSGVNEGERIVVKGTFTLKSESLKGLMEEE